MIKLLVIGDWTDGVVINQAIYCVVYFIFSNVPLEILFFSYMW